MIAARRHLLPLATLLLVALPAAAEAAWKPVTGVGKPDSITAEAGVARTADGVLHVLWPQEGDGNDGSVLHSAVSGTQVTGPNTVFHFAGGANNSMDLITAPDGLRAFFSGLSDNNTDPQQTGMLSALSGDGGLTWATSPGIVSDDDTGDRDPVYAASGIGAALGQGNVPLFAWGDSAPRGNGYHLGLSPDDPEADFESSCCGGAPDIGVDSVTGRAVLAWKFLTDTSGTAVMPIAPAGPKVIPPGAAAADLSTRTGITGRIGAPGVYVAYQQGTNQFLSRPAVYNVDTNRATVLETKRGGRMIGISPAPGGRLWVFWMRDDRLRATRSDQGATKWGAIVTVKPPGGTTSIHNLAGEGSTGPLDLLALVTRSGDDVKYWHNRIAPGLTLKTVAGKGKLAVTVSDAGKPLSGVKLKVGGQSKSTNSSGKASFSLKKRRYTLKAAKAGYTPAKKRVRVK